MSKVISDNPLAQEEEKKIPNGVKDAKDYSDSLVQPDDSTSGVESSSGTDIIRQPLSRATSLNKDCIGRDPPSRAKNVRVRFSEDNQEPMPSLLEVLVSKTPGKILASDWIQMFGPIQSDLPSFVDYPTECDPIELPGNQGSTRMIGGQVVENVSQINGRDS